jgi:hypothetical protein
MEKKSKLTKQEILEAIRVLKIGPQSPKIKKKIQKLQQML